MANGVRSNPAYPVIAASDALFARAESLIPAGTQTFAKGPAQHVLGVAPKYLRRGRGARVWDVDGNEFLDLSMAVGPLSLGYANPLVDEAIRAQLEDGITFSLMHPLEVEVAELLRELVPGAEAVRFSKTGADVTSAAVRLARAFTRRDRILCCGYHGWHDWYIATTDRAHGVPAAIAALTHTLAYNDVAALDEALREDVAAVILEPTVFEAPASGFLEELRALCTARGILLVFDEMWTGFRLALGGAQERFDIRADLACFSKALANGMPLSALTGRAEVMRLLEDDVFFFTTFGGEALSLAAAKATLGVLEREDVPGYLEALGGTLREGYNELSLELGTAFTRCVGFPARTMVLFEPVGQAKGVEPLLLKSFVQQELIRCGVLWNGFHNLSFAHRPDDITYLLGAYREALVLLVDALATGTLAARLRGEPMRPAFRRTSAFHTKPAPPRRPQRTPSP